MAFFICLALYLQFYPGLCIRLCRESAKRLPHRDPYGINEVLAQLFKAEA